MYSLSKTALSELNAHVKAFFTIWGPSKQLKVQQIWLKLKEYKTLFGSIRIFCTYINMLVLISMSSKSNCDVIISTSVSYFLLSLIGWLLAYSTNEYSAPPDGANCNGSRVPRPILGHERQSFQNGQSHPHESSLFEGKVKLIQESYGVWYLLRWCLNSIFVSNLITIEV